MEDELVVYPFLRAGIMRDKALRDAREEQQELEALHRLDEECVHQQRAGNYLKAFDCMERALVLRRHFFGIESEEVIQACRALAEMCNLLAMSFLQQDNYAVTIDLLMKAEVLTQRHHPSERSTTLNNLACYYRRLGKLHSAMTSLKRALELEKRLENVRNAADTQLNMCAVLSQLGKHQEALEHAQEALITLQEGFIHGKHTTDTTGDSTTGDTSNSRLDRISVMCIAYHNIGVEQEFLKGYAESVASYKKGIGLAEQYLGADHSITTTIRNSYLAAKRTLATKARVRPCSASRDEKSPSKAGSRLLLSPRTGSLRMPSPLAKDKDRHSGSQIPTPRSIIADALSRGPLSALPPLEMQSPPSAGKKKKKSEPSEGKCSAPPLSPTDPFFSPRFKFDSNAPEGKPKKLVSITSPRSAAATSAELKTPASSKGKRERRKSSVKKTPTTPETAEKAVKPSHEERMKTAPTSEKSVHTSTVGSQDANGMAGTDDATRRTSNESVTIEPNEEPLQNNFAPVVANTQLPQVENSELKSSSRSHELETIEGDVNFTDVSKQPEQESLAVAVLSAINGEAVENFEVEDVNSTVLMVLNSAIELVADQESDFPSWAAVEDEDTNVEQPRDERKPLIDDTDDQTTAFSSGGTDVESKTENYEDHDAFNNPEFIQNECTNNMNDIEVSGGAATDNTTGGHVTDNMDMNTVEPSEATTEKTYLEEPTLISADEATESRLLSPEEVVDTATFGTEYAIDEEQIDSVPVQLDLEVNITEDVENVEVNEEATTEETLVMEDSVETVLVGEDHTLPPADEETTDFVENSDAHDNEDPLLEDSGNYETALVNVHEAEQLIESTTSVELQEEGQMEEPHFSNDAEDFASALFNYEAQQDLQIDNSGGYYEDTYTSVGYTTPEVEANEIAYEEAPYAQVDVGDNAFLEPEFYDQAYQVAFNFEVQGDEDIVDPSALPAEQDWNSIDPVEPTTMEKNAEYFTENGDYPDVLAHEEFSGEHAAITEPNTNEQQPEVEDAANDGGVHAESGAYDPASLTEATT